MNPAAAPADDDDLVNALLSDGDDFSIDPPAPAADDAVADDAGSAGDFAGLDVGTVDFTESADVPQGDASDDDAATVIDSGPMKPGTFS